VGALAGLSSRAPALALAIGIAVVVAACGREGEPDLVNGKQLFNQKCGSCHVLKRAATAGKIGPDLDEAFRAAREDGLGEQTIEGVVRQQIDSPRKGSQMPADLVTGGDARDVAAYVAMVAAVPGEDRGALARAGLAGATDPRQIFTAAGCGACHTLAAAGSRSDIGPSLDELRRTAARRRPGLSAEEYAREAIVDPRAFAVSGFPADVMPTDYRERLEPKQIDALVRFLLGR
jgi:mono/diheme cytochrome c family protein